MLKGLTGAIGAGKSTVAGKIDESAMVCSFAEPIYEALSLMSGYSVNSIKDYKGNTSPFGGKTWRYLLQTFGTDWGRNLIDDEFWIKIFEARYDRYLREGKSIIIDDVRFANEADYIHSKGGIIIKIIRPNYEPELCVHESENQDVPFDGIFVNE